MFKFVFQKIMNKKWLISCLLAGAILLIAIAACNPMYTNAALQKTLTDELEEQMLETGQYPAIAHVNGTFSEARLQHCSSELFSGYEKGAEELAALYEKEAVEKVTLLSTGELDMKLVNSRTGLSSLGISVNHMFDMEEHINIIFGENYSDECVDGVYECIISESVLVSQGVVIGDVFTTNQSTPDGNPIQFKIVGVFEAAEENDLYWVNDPLDYSSDFFISKNVFDEIYMDALTYSVRVNYYAVFDYRDINIDEINSFIETDNKIRKDCVNGTLYDCSFNYEEAFNTYGENSNKVTVTMWVFQIPVLILLCVFIYMVSNQIISIEQSEIAMLKSRGVSKKQLMMSYLMQGSIISAVALIIGIPLGYLFCNLFGATKSFLEFSVRTSIDVKITGLSIVFALVAAIISILFMTLPVLKYANFSIVEQKVNKKKSKKPLWQMVFLDFILLAISIYGFYSFNKQKDIIIKNISDGSALDPLLYFSSTVFILSVALIFLRVIPFTSRLVYKIGEKRWKPNKFAAFMQINKSIRKQSFIMVFLTLTLALGIFNATTARTINDNEERRINNSNGASLVVQQTWSDNSAIAKDNDALELEYYEPDYTVYNKISDKVNGMTKVIVDEYAGIEFNSDILRRSTTFMAVTTDEFGKVGHMADGVNKFHWYYYLNALAQDPYGAIISRNYAELAGLGVGDEFILYRNDKLGKSLPMFRLNVVAIVDAWPGYESKVYGEGLDGKMGYQDHYLVVANFDTARKNYGLEPYQIWIDTDNTDFFYDFAAANGLEYTIFNDSQAQCDEVKEQPFFQVTSGMLTITFFVVLILSMIGFLIYWVTSIKSRELIFGIYRAMGMSMKEIISMLIFEHVFGSLIPIICGILIGVVAAQMFVPLIQLAYTATYSTLETLVITSARDMFNLGLCVVVMLVICFVVIGRLLRNMKIAQALKLGED